MKKNFNLILMAVTLCVTLISCSPKSTAQSVNINRSSIAGDWSLNNITFDNISEGSLKSFLGEHNYKCFIGSIWNLSGSGNGEYLIPNNNHCSAKTQSIFWSYNSTDALFQYKLLAPGEKAKTVKDGYKLLVASNNKTDMTIKVPITSIGGTAFVNLHFQKLK